MKKHIILLAGILTIISFSGMVSNPKGGKPFEGTIKYSITVEGASLSEAEKAQYPSESVITIKGNKTKTEEKTLYYSRMTIADSETQSIILLFNMETAGIKKFVKFSKEYLEKQFANLPTYDIKEVNETKKIAGYTCKKAEITDEEGNVIVTYYCDELNVKNHNWENPQMKNIKGMPLEFSQPTGNTTMKFIAKEIKKSKVKDKEFEIPEGYTEMTEEEATQMFGGF